MRTISLLFGAAALIACVPAAVPPALDLVACVTQGAVAKHSVARIALDCGADVLSVVDVLIESADPSVGMSPAGAEAQTLQSKLGAHRKAPACK